MLGRGVGLIELVERARDSSGVLTLGPQSKEAADEECWFVLCGQLFRPAGPAFDPDHPDDLIGPRFLRSVNWQLFRECVSLAWDIDAFLATLEADRRTAGMARSCREELDLLPVLADLCEDCGLPQAANEARHLYGIVATERWECPTPVFNEDDEDFDEDEME